MTTRHTLPDGLASTLFPGSAPVGPHKIVQAQASHPDARLLALGADLDQQEIAIQPLRAAYCRPDATPAEEAAYEAADDKLNKTTEAILAEPATTAEGFAVKARALAYIYHEGFTAESLESLNGDTTDWALVRSILFGLLALGGQQKGGAA